MLNDELGTRYFTPFARNNDKIVDNPSKDDFFVATARPRIEGAKALAVLTK